MSLYDKQLAEQLACDHMTRLYKEQTSYPDDNPKTAIGVTKVPLHLVPPVAKQALAEALGDGAGKYGPYNWREKRVSASVYYAAAQRHMDAWWDGEDRARDSQVLHLAHAMACLAIIIDGLSIDKMNDDRPPTGAAVAWQERYAETKKNKEQHAGNNEPEQLDLFKQDSSTSTSPSLPDPVVKRGVSDVQADVRSYTTDISG